MNTTLSDPSHSPLFPRGPGLGLKFAFFVLLSLGLLFVDGRGSESLAPVRHWTSWALTPVLWFAGFPTAVSGGIEHLHTRESLLSENRELKETQLKQEARLLRLAALEAENQRIRELLASASALSDRVLIAEILATSQDPYRHQIVLNKGERDGVYRGQALVDASGVMGQVVQVNPSSSVALLITDPDHGIPVEVNRTGLQTIALGRGDGQGLSLPYLPGNADVKVGDLLVSSGLGGRFPAGYPVGEVHELRHAGGESFMEAVAYPRAKLHQGRQALLVWSERAAHGLSEEPPAEVPIDLPGRAAAAAIAKPAKNATAPATAAKNSATAAAATAKPAPAPGTNAAPASPKPNPPAALAGPGPAASPAAAAAKPPAAAHPGAPAVKAPEGKPAPAQRPAPKPASPAPTRPETNPAVLAPAHPAAAPAKPGTTP
ncbi:MAG: hypothetical protein NVS9B10_10980 [Nevskia sp.]